MTHKMQGVLIAENRGNLALLLIVWQEHMHGDLVKRKMLKKIKHFLQRDQDITLYDEWHYIFITLRELVEVVKTKNK